MKDFATPHAVRPSKSGRRDRLSGLTNVPSSRIAVAPKRTLALVPAFAETPGVPPTPEADVVVTFDRLVPVTVLGAGVPRIVVP